MVPGVKVIDDPVPKKVGVEGGRSAGLPGRAEGERMVGQDLSIRDWRRRRHRRSVALGTVRRHNTPVSRDHERLAGRREIARK